ncbi:MAG: response regulator [SAR324 cluster bacterium]|nr:response regulator [SAR324 cluster bacterium]
MKILVVEDSSIIRQVIVRELSSGGHDVTQAEDGEAALKILKTQSFDLISLDIEMPGINGYEVCKEFRKFETLTKNKAPTPILFLTAEDSLEGRLKGFDVGGTEFFVKPFAKGELLEAIERLFLPVKTFKNKCILIVDDAQVLRTILSSILIAQGVKVIEAVDGEEAFEILKNSHKTIDLVITDYEMPKMKGDELCQKIRSHLGLAEMPIIFLTAASEVSYILEMFASGANDLIHKPFSKEELVARLNLHLKEMDLKTQLVNTISKLKRANITLNQMAITDGLTQLYNHKHIKEQLEVRLQEASRHNKPVSVLMFDIDHFKKVNDTHGHQTGDHVIAKIAEVIVSQVRDIDLVGRYGGEEFLVILPETNLEQALIPAENIRKAIENSTWPVPEMVITISGGLKSFESETCLELINCCDQLLYKAKEGGRNQICS